MKDIFICYISIIGAKKYMISCKVEIQHVDT